MQNDFSENKKNIPYSLVPADDRNVEPQDESMVGLAGLHQSLLTTKKNQTGICF